MIARSSFYADPNFGKQKTRPDPDHVWFRRLWLWALSNESAVRIGDSCEDAQIDEKDLVVYPDFTYDVSSVQ